MAENRRDFLKRAGGTAALGLPVLGGASVSAHPGPEERPWPRPRPRWPHSTLFLEVGGQPAGPLGSDSSGGYAFADVVTERPGPDRVAKKHLANLRYADIALSVGAGMGSAFYDWIQGMRNGTRRDGAIVTTDFSRRERRRREFREALVTEVEFPALDAGSRDRVSMSVKITPEVTRDQAASGQVPNWPGGPPPLWLASSFRLMIDGLEDATRHTVQVDALPLRTVIATDGVGDERDPTREPPTLEVPNLAFTVPEAEAEALLEWFDSFVVRGNCADDQEKSGTLEHLSANRSTVLSTLRFGHLGLFKLAPARTEGVPLLKAEMYCETLDFLPGNA